MKLIPSTLRIVGLLAMLGLPLWADSGDTITKKDFGTTADGQPNTLYTLSNSHGMSVSVMNWGARNQLTGPVLSPVAP